MTNTDRMLEAVRNGNLNRRQFGQILAGLGVVVTSTAYGSRPVSADEEQPTFFTWATMDAPEFFPTYIAKHGVPPKFAVFGDQDEAILKVRGGFKPDVVYPQSYTIRRWHEAGLVEAIDTSKLSNWNDIFPNLRDLDGVQIDGETVWVPTDWGFSSVLVRTDLAPDYADAGSDNWDILWDQKYSGRLAALDSMADAVGAAALHVGVNAYDMSDDDVAKVRAALVEQRPLLRFYSNDPTTVQQALASGEVIAANTWSDSYVSMKEQGLPVRYMRPKQGIMAWVGGLSIVKGTPHKELAHEVIDAYLDRKARAFGMSQYGYGSATAGGFAEVDDATLQRLDLPRDPAELLAKSIVQVPMKNQNAIQQMFEQVKQGM
jgi:spermidine/putrescine transport system substrate-binding protein